MKKIAFIIALSCSSILYAGAQTSVVVRAPARRVVVTRKVVVVTPALILRPTTHLVVRPAVVIPAHVAVRPVTHVVVRPVVRKRVVVVRP